MAYDIHWDEPLVGDIDVEEVLRLVPALYTMKGMFLEPVAAALKNDWDACAGKLLAPPRGGKYVRFTDYPIVDYLRLFDAVARRTLGPPHGREAWRRLARSTVGTFVATTLGRVTFSLLGDPAVTLLKYPESFGVLSQGPVAKAERVAADRVVVTYTGYAGPIEYAIGVLEGLVLSFEKKPRLVVKGNGAEWAVDVSWA